MQSDSYLLPSKIEGNDFDSNIVQVRLENISVCGNRVRALAPMFTVGSGCNVEIK